MKRLFTILFSGIFAGLLISIGGTVFLATKNISFIGASFLFAFGLFIIINFGLYLYTGKIGYVGANDKSFLLDLLFCLLGNAIGSIGIGYLLRLASDRYEGIIDTAISISNVKLNSNIFSILILSFFCGVMIYLAVEVSKKDFHPLIKVLAIFLAVAIFILSGFEHCIANMFYFSVANAWSGKTILYVLMMILGNSLGSITIFYLQKLAKL